MTVCAVGTLAGHAGSFAARTRSFAARTGIPVGKPGGPAKQHLNKICEICENLWKIGDAFLRNAGHIGEQLVSTERCIPTGCFASHAA